MIVVYGIADRLNPIKRRLSDAIHSCMQAVLGMPEDKRAQRFIPLARDDFFMPGGRSDAYTVIEINMMQGRTEQTKKALIHRLFSVLEAELGLAPVDVEITIHEQPPHCWGFRGMTGDEARLNYEVNV
ncbi:MAG TPA: tautomerase family protein [Polyangiaceae bacterium]|nr:tautomerase family protein [Polyangiaceae bacterium]